MRSPTHAAARRIVVVVVGTTLLFVGLVLVFTPGPAIVVLALALGVFAAEFTWARRWLQKLRQAAHLSVSDRDRREAGGPPARGEDGERRRRRRSA